MKIPKIIRGVVMLDHLWITSILFSFINNKIFVFHLLYNLVYLGKYVLNTYFCKANYQYCYEKQRERECVTYCASNYIFLTMDVFFFFLMWTYY